MAEAEEVITDVARHATVYARDLWRRHRRDVPGPRLVALRDVAARLDLLVSAVFGRTHPLRVADPPAPATFLTKVFRRQEGPRVVAAVPSTDGFGIWLPGVLGDLPGMSAIELYRAMTLQQAMRAQRGSAEVFQRAQEPVVRAVFVILEAAMADAALVRALPGIAPSLLALRRHALATRPALSDFPRYRQPLERFVRAQLQAPPGASTPVAPDEVLTLAREQAATMAIAVPRGKSTRMLYRDLWTGEVQPRQAESSRLAGASETDPQADQETLRSARLARAPKVREAEDDEDDDRQSPWMVQTAQPHEQVEDPFGMQRPSDRDESTATDDLADALSELPEARLVAAPGRPKEVLLSPDEVASRAKKIVAPAEAVARVLRYPEWDYRIQAYRESAASVHSSVASEGPQEWVEQQMTEHRSTARLVQRRFEMLKAQRVRLRRQLDGDDIDLDAYVEAQADYRAGRSLSQAVYETHRKARRDLAVLLLVDVSGSTDGWVSASKRVVDVEREALLLVCIALQGMSLPFAVQAFSGEGPHGVVVRAVKDFDELYDDRIARRIASLEPEHYTRAGAPMRHATATLLRKPASHRLLLLLSDGKPNDVDEYEGRYGVEDMRQAVTEAKLQGIHSFCLTVDRQGASYLPLVFGTSNYALLPRPELLPTVLLEWMKRLLKQ
jgi:nitric oxide reductase NorD protein